MAFLNSLNIPASALTATRLKMDVVSQNIANQSTTRTENGGPYRRKTVEYQPITNKSFNNMLVEKMGNTNNLGGVKVTKIGEDESEFNKVFNPSHPDADENGYVLMPNVDPVQEMMDMISATRAYDLNLTSMDAIKNMAVKALEIGK